MTRSTSPWVGYGAPSNQGRPPPPGEYVMDQDLYGSENQHN